MNENNMNENSVFDGDQMLFKSLSSCGTCTTSRKPLSSSYWSWFPVLEMTVKLMYTSCMSVGLTERLIGLRDNEQTHIIDKSISVCLFLSLSPLSLSHTHSC